MKQIKNIKLSAKKEKIKKKKISSQKTLKLSEEGENRLKELTQVVVDLNKLTDKQDLTPQDVNRLYENSQSKKVQMYFLMVSYLKERLSKAQYTEIAKKNIMSELNSRVSHMEDENLVNALKVVGEISNKDMDITMSMLMGNKNKGDGNAGDMNIFNIMFGNQDDLKDIQPNSRQVQSGKGGEHITKKIRILDTAHELLEDK